MLVNLRIQNYALIRDLDIELSDNLITITGETGTGKSIMLGALGLILGNRADTSALLDENRKCVVEGIFKIQDQEIQRLFKENDLDWDNEIILRREISPGGKSRAFINDTPVTLSVMKDIGDMLVDIHSQHQTLKIAQPAFQIALLDALAGHKQLLGAYTKLFKEYKSLKQEIERLEYAAAHAQKSHDYDLFQLNEITMAGLQPGELEKLEEELNILSNAEGIQSTLSFVKYTLYESDESVTTRLGEMKRQLAAISNLNPRLAEFHDRLGSMLVETNDIFDEVANFIDTISLDEERMQHITDRLQIINNLLNKHHLRTVEELLVYAGELEEKVHQSDNISGNIERLKKRLGEVTSELETLSTALTRGRKIMTSELQEKLADLLKQLGIPEAQIVINLKDLPEFGETGKDKMEMLFSANKGARPGPVSDVASGGELSRLMLSIKYILADSVFLPTIVFDEIDTGVSGEVAIQIGRMLKRLAEAHQVVVITHQPQVAAMGAHQFIVYKSSGEEITSTRIRPLEKEERVEEIAKMIAGHKPSISALESAKEMLIANA